MIDLHTHSTASDGSLSPGALIQAAAERGLTAIALTDHDTIAGLQEARVEAERRSIQFIPGVEISIEPAPEKYSGEFHLLGLGITRPSAAFLEAVDQLALRRTERNREILDRMNEQGVEADYEEVRAFSGGHSVGRPHFARLLIRRKIVKNMRQAFDRYLAEGKPFYVPKTGMNFDKAVAAIKGSGGIAVLAHPLSLFVAWGRLPALIQSLKEKGLAGIEAWHPTAKESACKRLEALGKSLGLIITAGSDFHGEARPDRKLGITAGDRKIGEEFLAFQSASTEKIS